MLKSWKLWLDDQLADPDCPIRHVPDGFIGAANVDEAIALVKENGIPEFMDLDHDLADGKDAMTFLHWLADEYWTEDDSIPDFSVHSANPIGKQNIESFMKSWKRAYGRA